MTFKILVVTCFASGGSSRIVEFPTFGEAEEAVEVINAIGGDHNRLVEAWLLNTKTGPHPKM